MQKLTSVILNECFRLIKFLFLQNKKLLDLNSSESTIFWDVIINDFWFMWWLIDNYKKRLSTLICLFLSGRYAVARKIYNWLSYFLYNYRETWQGYLPCCILSVNKCLWFPGKVRAMKHFPGWLYDYTIFWKLRIFKVTSYVLLLAVIFSVHKPLVLALYDLMY